MKNNTRAGTCIAAGAALALVGTIYKFKHSDITETPVSKNSYSPEHLKPPTSSDSVKFTEVMTKLTHDPVNEPFKRCLLDTIDLREERLRNMSDGDMQMQEQRIADGCVNQANAWISKCRLLGGDREECISTAKTEATTAIAAAVVAANQASARQSLFQKCKDRESETESTLLPQMSIREWADATATITSIITAYQRANQEPPIDVVVIADVLSGAKLNFLARGLPESVLINELQTSLDITNTQSADDFVNALRAFESRHQVVLAPALVACQTVFEATK